MTRFFLLFDFVWQEVVFLVCLRRFPSTVWETGGRKAKIVPVHHSGNVQIQNKDEKCSHKASVTTLIINELQMCFQSACLSQRSVGKATLNKIAYPTAFDASETSSADIWRNSGSASLLANDWFGKLFHFVSDILIFDYSPTAGGMYTATCIFQYLSVS